MSHNEGWANDITTRNRRHYYKDGVSLCGKAKEKHHMRHFDRDSKGSHYACDCNTCIRKLVSLKTP